MGSLTLMIMKKHRMSAEMRRITVYSMTSLRTKMLKGECY